MNVKDFYDKYFLHDSSIENIIYDEQNKKLSLTIEFCFWMQNWYVENEPPNGKISVVFENVSVFDCSENLSDELDNEILNVKFEDGVLIIYVRETVNYKPPKEIFYQIKIKAGSVEVREKERYYL